MIESYPLTWPMGQPRTKNCGESAFKLPIGIARDRLLNELRLLDTRDVVISSNLPMRRDGLPYANASEPSDPGVAVYFDRRVGVEVRHDPSGIARTASAWKPYVIACDTYRRFVWNLRAVGVTVEALRTIQRHGASSMLEQAFTGFAALPAHSNGAKPWWEVLGVSEGATADEIKAAWIELSKIHHPDTGGSHERMVEINAAFQASGAR
jgi:hypothetical protein